MIMFAIVLIAMIAIAVVPIVSVKLWMDWTERRMAKGLALVNRFGFERN